MPLLVVVGMLVQFWINWWMVNLYTFDLDKDAKANAIGFTLYLH